MHCRTAQNLVLFNQSREHGIRCTWTGLNKMAIFELLTVCTSTKNVNKFQDGLMHFSHDKRFYNDEEFAYYLLQSACPKLPLTAFNYKKCDLLFGLFKKHGLETFTTQPSHQQVIHEMLDIYAANGCDVNKVARDVFVMIVGLHLIKKSDDEILAAISYLTEHRGVDVNTLNESDFSSLLECLQKILLLLCSVFSTPTTSVFLHTKLSARKIGLLWRGILKHLPANMCPGSVDLVRSFIARGCDVTRAIYRVNFSHFASSWFLLGLYCSPAGFHQLLEIIEIFMDHGARLNPLPGSNERPFLTGILKVYHVTFLRSDTRSKLYGFITKCIQRGVDPNSYAMKGHILGHIHEDLLSAVYEYYDADDKIQLIEFLCDCGADASLSRNNGADLWFLLRQSNSSIDFVTLRFNETLLVLLRRGLRTDCIDLIGNNVLHMYLRLYAAKPSFGSYCMRCKFGWFRALDELKFWDVLVALLDSGVKVNHVNKDGETPVGAFKEIMPRDYERITQSVCSKCCVTCVDAELTRWRNYTDRLSPFSL